MLSKKFLNYINKLGQLIFIPIEQLLVWGTKKNAIQSIEDYPELKILANRVDEILAEYQHFIEANPSLPYMDDLSFSQKKIVTQKKWGSIFLRIYGRDIPKMHVHFKTTMGLLKEIPGVKTAFFSVFAPKTHLLPHRGPYKGVIRYHLGLIVPENCGIKIDGKTHSWSYGQALLFDDTYIHEAWNNAASERVVLFLDIERRLPFFQSCLNRCLLFLIGKSPFVSEIYSNAKEYQANLDR